MNPTFQGLFSGKLRAGGRPAFSLAHNFALP
jgi:hypothetical protein